MSAGGKAACKGAVLLPAPLTSKIKKAFLCTGYKNVTTFMVKTSKTAQFDTFLTRNRTVCDILNSSWDIFLRSPICKVKRQKKPPALCLAGGGEILNIYGGKDI